LLFVLFLLIILPAFPVRSEELPNVHLKVIGGLGQTSQYKEQEEPFWTKRIPERSGGKITAEISPYDQDGLSGPEVLQFARLGAITIGNVPLAQIASEDPEVAGLDLAGMNPDVSSLRRSIDAYLPTLTALYRDLYSLEVLAIWTNPAQVVFCNKSISGLADLSGFRVRVASAMHADFASGLGASGITIPYKGLMHALQNNVADCAITGAISGYRSGLHTVTSHLEGFTVSWGPNILIANRNAWRRLGEPVQKFLREQLSLLSDEIWAGVERESSQGIACVTGRGPCPIGPPGQMKYVPPSDADGKLVKQVLSDVVLPRWIERCGAECGARWNDTVGRLWGLRATLSEH